MSDNNQNQGKDVKALFGALGIDAERYKNSTQERKNKAAEEAAEARWPLLAELRESLDNQKASEQAQYTPAAEHAPVPPAPQVDAKIEPPPSPDLSEDTPASVAATAPKPEPTPEIFEPEPVSDIDERDEAVPPVEPNQPEVPTAPPSQTTRRISPSLAEVFGLREAPQREKSGDRQPPQYTPADSKQSEESRPQASTDGRENLQSLFARLRGSEPAQRREPPAEKKQNTGLSGIFDRLRGK